MLGIFIFLSIFELGHSVECWGGSLVSSGSNYNSTTSSAVCPKYCYITYEASSNMVNKLITGCGDGKCSQAGCTSTAPSAYCCCQDQYCNTNSAFRAILSANIQTPKNLQPKKLNNAPYAESPPKIYKENGLMQSLTCWSGFVETNATNYNSVLAGTSCPGSFCYVSLQVAVNESVQLSFDCGGDKCVKSGCYLENENDLTCCCKDSFCNDQQSFVALTKGDAEAKTPTFLSSLKTKFKRLNVFPAEDDLSMMPTPKIFPSKPIAATKISLNSSQCVLRFINSLIIAFSIYLLI